jgi:predicted lysophospholipase L1 biosynthesis ABC-type transport system permease subunit
VKLGPASSTRPWRTVVGVVADEPSRAAAQTRQSAVYVPLAQWPGRPLSIVARVRSPADARGVVAAIPGAAASALPDEPVENVRTLAEGARAEARPFWLITLTLVSLAAFAVLVAAIGVYGVVAYGAARRTREIGIRVTLGATRRDVLALFGGQAARLAAAGVALGLAGAAASTRVIRGLLFGTDPLDPAVLLAVTALLALVTMLAAYLPAHRASRVDPTMALRSE